MSQKLLIIDDEPAVLRSLKRIFRKKNYEILTAGSAEEGLQTCQAHKPQVILSDFILPGANGSELLQSTSQLVPAPVGILMSGHADLNLVLAALNSGQVFKFITKPWDEEELLDQVQTAFELYNHRVLPPFSPNERECVVCVDERGTMLEPPRGQVDLFQLSALACGESVPGRLPGLNEQKLAHLAHHPGNSITLANDFGEPQYRACMRARSQGVYELLLTHLVDNETVGQERDLISQCQIQEAINQRLEKAETSSVVACIEVARFRELSRQSGFMAYSRLMTLLCKHIKQFLPHGSVISASGAEQLVVLLPVSEGAAIKHLQGVVEHFARPVEVFDKATLVQVYIGYAIAHPRDATVDAQVMLQRASSAVHTLVEGGNVGQVHAYDPRFDRDIANRDRLENSLFGALERNEFSLVYQPKVDLSTGKIVGAEALLRWRHHELGLVSPAVFIPLAEENGLIHIIGDWVLAAACAQVRVWRLQGVPSVPISVNLAAPQLRNDSLVNRIKSIIHESGSLPEDLKIELTETSLIQNVQSSYAQIEELRALGIGVALDDFGTGYSSLGYLHQLPIDVLKIDKCFIDEISPGNRRGRLVKHIINMAHDMGFEVIAEGVESPYQLDVLHQYECDIVQGYVYSPPVAPDILRDMIREQPFEM